MSNNSNITVTHEPLDAMPFLQTLPWKLEVEPQLVLTTSATVVTD